MEFLTTLGLLAAVAFGFYLGRQYSGNAQEKQKLEEEIREKQAELDQFRGKVNQHFETTAKLFNQVSESYQDLYDHIAKSSNQLCATQTFNSLPEKSRDAEALENNTSEVKADSDSADQFDANKLYKAHDYRNKNEKNGTSEKTDFEVKVTKNKSEKKNEKVVDIETAKEDKNPPLDYAIKEKGVVNHNSLNNDKNTKSS
ncbi:MAG: YhcB family protein [Gammaproteobacteria bacterium]|nr:YhcB family protein [Gammaproteobacteria bacterium]MDH5628992.1 YhcB family protein [Gammaproteobacteria bacterium]